MPIQGNKDRPAIFEFLELQKSTLLRSGEHQLMYRCTICSKETGLPCNSSVTCYSTGKGKSVRSSNAWAHLRRKAKYDGDEAHAEVHASILESNRKRVLDKDGEYVSTMSFDEAFTHHVDFIWCRARGIFGANVGRKSAFAQYVRGAALPPPHPPPPDPPPSISMSPHAQFLLMVAPVASCCRL